MTQNQPEGVPQYTEEQVRGAEAAEQASLDESQKEYLKRRVVILRVQCDKLLAELTQAREEILLLQGSLPKDNEIQEDTAKSEDGP